MDNRRPPQLRQRPSESESESMDSNTKPPNFNPQTPPPRTSKTKIGNVNATTPPNFDLQSPPSNTRSGRAAEKPVGGVNQPPEKTVKPTSSNIRVRSIKIGPNWQRKSKRTEDLRAKFYFLKQKLIWELLEANLVLVKIEVCWSDITAINAHMPPNQPGLLRIEVGKTPSFYRETPANNPRQHRLWEPTFDFTDGHATIYRMHEASFPPGELDKHLENLLQSDQRLLELSRNPFPTHHTTFVVDNTAPPEEVGQSYEYDEAALFPESSYNLQALDRKTEQWLQELGSKYILDPEMTYLDNIYGGATTAAPEHVQQHSTAAAEYVGQSSTSSTIGLSHDEAALFPESSYNLQALAEDQRETEQWLQELGSNYTFHPEMTYSDNIYGGATAAAAEHVQQHSTSAAEDVGESSITSSRIGGLISHVDALFSEWQASQPSAEELETLPEVLGSKYLYDPDMEYYSDNIYTAAEQPDLGSNNGGGGGSGASATELDGDGNTGNN